MALVLRILTAKEPFLFEIFYSVVSRKFPFFESRKPIEEAKGKGIYTYLTTLGFDTSSAIKGKTTLEIKKYYQSEEQIEIFFRRLETYCTLYFGVVSTNIEF